MNTVRLPSVAVRVITSMAACMALLLTACAQQAGHASTPGTTRPVILFQTVS